MFWFVFSVVLVIICTSKMFASLFSSEETPLLCLLETPLLCLLLHKMPKAYEEHKVLYAAIGQARLYKYNLLSSPVIILMIHFASAEFHVLVADVDNA